MQVEQHFLFEFVFAIVDIDGVIVSIEVVNERLDGGFTQVSEVGRGLPWRDAHHRQLRVDGAESVDHHCALHTLNRIHHDRHCTLVQRLETLLSLDTEEEEQEEEEEEKKRKTGSDARKQEITSATKLMQHGKIASVVRASFVF